MLRTNTPRPTVGSQSPRPRWSTRVIGLLSAIFVAIVSHAQAAPDDSDQVAGRQAGFRQRLLERFDSNEDGVLSDEERAAVPRRAKKRARHRGRFGRRGLALKTFDSDGDGTLNNEERSNARAARKERILKHLDSDGDGTVSEEERSARPRRGKGRFRHRARFGRRGAQLRRFDTDGDGELSDEERASARTARKKHIIDRFDADGDGILSEEEKKTLRERPRGRRRCRGHHGQQRRTSRNEE